MHQNTSTQRDRERQRERERTQRQLTAAGGQDCGVTLESVAPSLFSAPIKQERDDETTKQIKNTLGNFSDFAQICLKSQSSELINPHLLGISMREMNRRKVEEIFTEMKNDILPISGLDDTDDVGGVVSTSAINTATVNSHYNSKTTPSGKSRLITSRSTLPPPPPPPPPASTSTTASSSSSTLISSTTVTTSNQSNTLQPNTSTSIASAASSTPTATTIHNHYSSQQQYSHRSNTPGTNDISHHHHHQHHPPASQQLQNLPNSQKSIYSHNVLSDDDNHPLLPNNKTIVDQSTKTTTAPTTNKSTKNFKSAQQSTNKLRLSHSSSDSSDGDEGENDASSDDDDSDDSSSGTSDSEPRVDKGHGSDKRKKSIGKQTKLNTLTSMDSVNSVPDVDKWALDNFIDIGEKQQTSTATNKESKSSYSNKLDNNNVDTQSKQSTSTTSRNSYNSRIDKYNKHKSRKSDSEEMEEGELEDDDNVNTDIRKQSKVVSVQPTPPPPPPSTVFNNSTQRYSPLVNNKTSLNKRIPKKGSSRFNNVTSASTPPSGTAASSGVSKSYASQAFDDCGLKGRNTNNSRSASLIRIPPPPPSTNRISTTSTVTKDTEVLAGGNDENSWKDVKRRKDAPATDISDNQLNRKSNSKSLLKKEHVDNDLGKKAKTISSSTSLLAPVDTKSVSKRPKLGTPDKTTMVKGHSELDVANKSLMKSTANKNEVDQMIVSIDLLKLNRVPCLERNGNIPKLALPPSADDRRSASPKIKEELNGKRSKSSTISKVNHVKHEDESKSSKQSANAKIKKNQLKVSDAKSRNAENLLMESKSSPNSLTVSIPVDSVTLKSTASPLADRSPNTNNISISGLSSQEALAVATTLKRKGDRCSTDPHKQVKLYIEAVLYFIQTGIRMEAKRTDSDMDRAYQMYKETLRLIKYTTKISPGAKSQQHTDHIDLKLTIISYRCQALLNLKLNRMKQRDLHENKETINQYLSDPTIAPILNNHYTTTANTISITTNVLQAFSKQYTLTQHTQTATDLWIKAEQIMETNSLCKEYFQTLDTDLGPLLLSSSFEHLIHYSMKGIRLLSLKDK